MSVDIKRILEALIFVSEGPLSLAQMGQVLETEDKEAVKTALEELVAEYHGLERAFTLVEVAGGWAFRTRPELAFWLRRLKREQITRLSQAALETLAIIAYKQPVLKAEIEALRGVEVGGVLRMLMEKGLVRVVGRKDLPGRPLVYGTSKRFLEVFNLKDLKDLPTMEEMEALANEPEESAKHAQEEDLFSRPAGLRELDEEEPALPAQIAGEEGGGEGWPEAMEQAPAGDKPVLAEAEPEHQAHQPAAWPAADDDPLSFAGEPPPRLRPVTTDPGPEGDDEPPQAA